MLPEKDQDGSQKNLEIDLSRMTNDVMQLRAVYTTEKGENAGKYCRKEIRQGKKPEQDRAKRIRGGVDHGGENGDGYLYDDSEASRAGSGSEARYGEARSGYRPGSGRAGEYYSENTGVGNDVGARYKKNSAKGADSGYRSEAYGSGAGHYTGYGQGGDQYESGYAGRSESNGAYRSGYGGGYVTGSSNRNGYEAGSGIGNAEYVADNGYYKQTP